MATEKIILETEVKLGNSGNSVKGLKQELRDLTKQLGTLDKDSKSFQQAAQRAGQLRDQIRGVNDAIENADPEKKFAPFVRTIGGLAGGFSAVQGAMALFGAESEDLQKTLVKVQGAMALSQGLNSMIEFKNDFADLGKLVVGNVTKAFSTLRGAIIATGIGAAAVAVGLLVANWKEFSTFVLKLIPGLETVGKFFGNIIQSITDFVGITSQAGRELDSLDKKNKKTNETLEQQIKIWEAVGGKEKEIYNAKKQLINNDLETLRKRLAVNGELTKEELKQFKELKNQLIIEDVNYNNFLDEQDKKRSEKRKKELKDFLEVEEAKQKRIDDKKAFDKRIALAEQEGESESKKKRKENEEKEKAEREKNYQEQLNKRRELKKANDEIEEAEFNAKMNSLQVTAQAISGFSQLMGRETAAGKALAIATTTIDTYVSAMKVFRSAAELPGGAFIAPLAAAGAIAAGLANVRAIMSVQIPSGGGGGGMGMPSAPSAPSFNPISQGIRIQGANEPIVTRNIRGQDNRVYVLESDITDKQNTVDGIKQKATVR